MVRSIVELHGGSVSASSVGPGLGACFTGFDAHVVKPVDLVVLAKTIARLTSTARKRRATHGLTGASA